jgi:hypothetical protein
LASGNPLVFTYEFQSPIVVLQTASNVGGPYVDLLEDRVDLSRRALSLANANPNRVSDAPG